MSERCAVAAGSLHYPARQITDGRHSVSDQARADSDGGWKDVIEDFVEEFFAFYFPEIHAAIDFSVPVKFLDKELRQIVTESEVAGREADKLMEVRLRDGRTEWLLVHVEVQGYRDRDFSERMFVYNYRIFDRYKRDVISLAVLTDSDPTFRPTEYRRDLLGSAVSFTFPTVKLIDYSPEELEASGSPFALVTQIQLEYLSAGSDQERRYDAKVALTLRLYDRGYSREQILRLHRFLDFLLRLRQDLAIQYKQRLESIEGDLKMPYVTSMERLAKAEALQEALLDALEARFGEVSYQLREAVGHVHDETRLRQLLRSAVVVEKLDDFNV